MICCSRPPVITPAIKRRVKKLAARPVQRKRLKDGRREVLPPAVHFGLVASGDSVIRSGVDRDRIAARAGVIAFEMEGAGVWGTFPCISIKGACDFVDSHESNSWQRYAAASAAACAKALLKQRGIEEQSTINRSYTHRHRATA
ncbi:hypothetical protein PWT90_07601 [Aphanocladium album]|nr:hypothetical protein PWT90_07601 [Aphanocladium album]